MSVFQLRKDHLHTVSFEMYPVSKIEITEDMTAEDIKIYFRDIGIVCSEEFKGEYLLKMTAIAKQRGQRIRLHF